MKIMLCNPLKQSLETLFQPLGMLYIASYLRQNCTEHLDFKFVVSKFEKEFLQFEPDVVFMSTISSFFNTTKELAKKFKALNNEVVIVVGGYHITALPQTLTEDMDVAVLGEGELTANELIDSNFSLDIKGIAYKNGAKLVVNEPRPLIDRLDDLPFPARDLTSQMFGTVFTPSVVTARGCPFNCIFCANSNFWQKRVRFHSAKYVMEDLKLVSEKYSRRIAILDDTFTINIGRLREIHKLIITEGLDLELAVLGRTDMITNEVCKLLVDIGVVDVGFGFESGDERILNYLKNGQVSVKDNVTAIKKCKEHGMKVSGAIVIGSPDETREEILESLKFIKDSHLSTHIPNILTPIPNTPLWEIALERGLVSNDMDWSLLNFSYEPPFRNDMINLNDNLTSKELYDLWFEFYKTARRLTWKDRAKGAIQHPIKAIKLLYKCARSGNSC